MIPVVLAIGDQIVEAYSRIGLVMALYLRFWGPGLLSTSPALSMSSASHSAGSSGRLAPKTGAGPTFQWAGKVDAICRSRSNRAKRPRAGCILRSTPVSLHRHAKISSCSYTMLRIDQYENNNLS